MKIFNFLFLILLFLTGCKNAEDLNTGLYFTGTEIDPLMKVAVEGPTDFALTVSSTVKAPTDTRIKIAANPDLVEAYNMKYKKNYKALPEGSYNLSTDELYLAAGETVSEQVTVALTSLDDFEEGVTYCMPISIVSTDGETPVLESSRTVYVEFVRTIITSAASTTSNYFRAPFDQDNKWSAVPNLTLEARVYVNQFQRSFPNISSVIGIEEHFLLRFGHGTVDNMNQLHLAGGGYEVTAPFKFSTHTWYHVAVTYDGAKIRIFVNGVEDASVDAPRGPINIALNEGLHDGFNVGKSAGGRYMDGMVSEVRVWSKALSGSDLLNNMCYVDPAADGLIAYWRFNEGEGDIVKDLTGHGYDMVDNRKITWKEGVRCPN